MSKPMEMTRISGKPDRQHIFSLNEDELEYQLFDEVTGDFKQDDEEPLHVSLLFLAGDTEQDFRDYALELYKKMQAQLANYFAWAVDNAGYGNESGGGIYLGMWHRDFMGQSIIVIIDTHDDIGDMEYPKKKRGSAKLMVDTLRKLPEPEAGWKFMWQGDMNMNLLNRILYSDEEMFPDTMAVGGEEGDICYAE